MSVRVLRRLVIGTLVVAGIGYLIWDQVRAHRELQEHYDAGVARIEAALPKDDLVATVPRPSAAPGDLTITLTSQPASETTEAQVRIQIGTDTSWTLP